MKSIKFFMFLLILCQILFGIDYVDVIYLKNGDVAKGIIIENVPNDYVKLESSGGTLLTFKYSEIEKFAKESKETNTQNVQFPIKGYSGLNDFDFNFSLRFGYHNPSEEAIKEIYGGGLLLGGDVTIWKNNIGANFCIENFNKDGKPYTYTEGDIDITDADCSISISPITISGLYKISNSNLPLVPYFGLGGGLFFVKEKIKMEYEYYDDWDDEWYSDSESASASDNIFGFIILAGVEIKPVFVEVKYTSASWKTENELAAAGTSANLGGINIYAGIKF